MSTQLADIEQAVREAEFEELEAYRKGTADAPLLYRPYGHVQVVNEKAASENGLMRFTASDESVDRMGDVIKVDGWELRDFKRNGPFLWAHISSAPPIGAVRRIGVEGKELIAGVEFAETTFASEIKALYEGAFLRAVSVGFRPLDFEPRQEKGEFAGFTFKRQELLELSAVPVPANAHALRKAYGDFAMTVPDLSKAFHDAMEESKTVTSGYVSEWVTTTTNDAKDATNTADPDEHQLLSEQEARDAWVRSVDERLGGLEERMKALEEPPEEPEETEDEPEGLEQLAGEIEDLLSAVAEKE